MPQVSKYPVSKNVYDRIFDIFLKSISFLGSKQESEKFLREFLTPTEQVMFAKRLAIGFLIMKKYDYRTISKVLRVSTGTVAGVSSTMQNGKYYRKLLEKLAKEEKVEEFLEKLADVVTSLFTIGGSKSGSWRYLKEEIRKKRLKKVL